MSDMHIEISIEHQRLQLFEHQQLLTEYSVSTASKGPGQQKNSWCTPIGRHLIRAKIGANAAAGTVFVGRRPTGECFSPELKAAHPDRDWILTRILWLSGLEPGLNRLGQVDSMQRYIYIHGTPDDQPMGVPASLGCIRMRNDAIIELFDHVPTYTTVHIQ